MPEHGFGLDGKAVGADVVRHCFCFLRYALQYYEKMVETLLADGYFIVF